MKNGILLICLVLAIIVVPIFGGCKPAAPTPEKAIELSYSHMWPDVYGQATLIADWAAEIEKRTNGKVKIVIYPANSLTTADQCYEGVVKGTSDIGHGCLAYTRGRFPLSEVLDLPGYTFNAMVTTLIAEDFYRKFKPAELSDTHILYMHTHIPGTISTVAGKPVRTLEDLKGLRIRATGLSAKIIEALGGAPVAMSAPEAYDALQKGVVDGTVGTPNMLKGFRFAEVTKYSVVCPAVGYATAFFIAMNLDTWNSLPKDVQKVFDEVSQEWVARTGERWNEMEVEGYQFAKGLGHEFIYVPEAEAARWVDAVKHLSSDYIAAMEAKGLPGKEALEYRQQLIEKYSKMYPPLELK
jgi:TRAP-type C4-dicarboxylate transport system substrate-binding protein